VSRETIVGFRQAPDFIRGACYGEAWNVGYEWAKAAWHRILRQAGYGDIDGLCKKHSKEVFCALSAEMSQQITTELVKYMDGHRHDHLSRPRGVDEPSDAELFSAVERWLGDGVFSVLGSRHRER